MRKILILLFFTFILSGCATYKFQKSDASGSQGYLVSYDGKPILEYTVGKEKSLPDLALARERFKRRRSTVEYYYKNTEVIESRFKEFLLDPPAMILDFLGGVLRWPFIAVADYKYNHDPKYKERVDKLDEQADAAGKARINSLQEKLAAYIVADLSKESAQQPSQSAPALPVAQEITTKAEVLPVAQPTAPQVVVPAPTAPTAPPGEIKPREQTTLIKPAPESPVAVIIARPKQGYSPLTVKFSGQKSHSKSGNIVSYLWDFGDGDTSTKKNPENTYWSTTFGSRNFTVALTVKDAAGATSSTTSIIAVSTP